MTQRRSSWEPKRWSETASDVPDALRLGLQDAREVQTDPAQVARLAERLGVSNGIALGVGLSSIAPATSVVAYKLWAYLSGTVALGGLALVMWSHMASAGAVEATVYPLASDVRQPIADTAALDPISPAVDHVAPVEKPPAAVTPTSREATTGTTRVRRRQLATAQVAVVEPPSSKLDPQAELVILNHAQDALAQAPRRALSLAEEHARSYPRGVFAQEREVIAIGALIKLQRSGDAAARGRAFLTTFPTSTHATRVQQMLGE